MGFRISGLGFRVSGLMCRVQGSELGKKTQTVCSSHSSQDWHPASWFAV